MTEKPKHVHKLKRLKYKSGNTIYFCALPDCNYKIAIPLALGKRCICWRCGNEFLINEYSLRLAKPHCDNCHNPKQILKNEIHNEETPIIHTELTLSNRLTQAIKKVQPEEGDI